MSHLQWQILIDQMRVAKELSEEIEVLVNVESESHDAWLDSPRRETHGKRSVFLQQP